VPTALNQYRVPVVLIYIRVVVVNGQRLAIDAGNLCDLLDEDGGGEHLL
jgi:hypothetical protein